MHAARVGEVVLEGDRTPVTSVRNVGLLSSLHLHNVGPEHCAQIALIKSRGPKGDQAWLKSSWAMS